MSVELVLKMDEGTVETASEALMHELQALAVSIEDSDANTEGEHALFGEPGMPPPEQAWAHSTLKVLFDSEAQAIEAATLLLAQDWARDVHVVSVADVPNEDWVRVTQSQFDPVAITPSFWIVPSWHEAPPAAQQVIRLDPGLAFGTGAHPTTHMCLKWIAEHPGAWPRVLDYGCGSGILAIGAALHGAQHIDAVDIDPAAVAATEANAKANAVSVCSGLPQAASGQYHLVLANILAKPLTLLAPLLCGHVRAGGHLVLAGILARQADELRSAYAPWIALDVRDEQDGWILMTGGATT
jgi:ribosomal protein L11 methyltransferase